MNFAFELSTLILIGKEKSNLYFPGTSNIKQVWKRKIGIGSCFYGAVYYYVELNTYADSIFSQ